MEQQITTIELSPQLVLGITQTGKYEIIPGLIGQLCGYAAQNKIGMIGAPLFLCHETSEQDALRANEEGSAVVEIAIPIKEKVSDAGEIRCYELPGGQMAKIMHYGPYDQCKPTYDKLFIWIAENGKTITGPIREIYLNDPREVKPEEILTEICVPIG
jgi:AraC family transcriptional regulator